jgi:uncharacterized protein
VLLLTGDGSHLQLPGDALAGEDALSVTGWLFLPTGASGPVFDFGQNPATRMFAVASKDGFRASASSWTVRRSPKRPTAVPREPVGTSRRGARSREPRALDLPRRRQGRAGADVGVTAAQIVQGVREPPLPRPVAGRRGAHAARAAARRPPLPHRAQRRAGRDDPRNGWPGASSRGRGAAPPEISTAAIPRESPLASRLSQRARRHGRDGRGMLPRLPATIPATYRDGRRGPDVRVIWPAPTDNSEVMKPGTYTVTGGCPARASSRRRRSS